MTLPPPGETGDEKCRCTMLTGQTPWQPAEWEQAEDCPVHPMTRTGDPRAGSNASALDREELRREIADIIGPAFTKGGMFMPLAVRADVAADALLPLIEAREARVRRETQERIRRWLITRHYEEPTFDIKTWADFEEAATGGQET